VKIPKNLGRYEVLDLISQGGMGTLFRARDPRIGRYVAVKVLKKDFDTSELRDRFSREARAAGCLSHPNIVTIYDVGEEDGLPFIAMEYVRGETFVEIIGLRPPLPTERKLQLMEEVCAGLNHAHEAGIVHRDIKPANLILSSEGVVKILDFGIAKLSSAGLTMPGVIMGTLNYMSPEQAKGQTVDARTDIFAVGSVMYELLSHQPAFAGTRAGEVLHRILSGTPAPITDYCPDLDPRVVQVIDRTLEKDPDRRFQTIAAVQKAIAAVRLDPRVSPTPPPSARPSRSPSNRAADSAALRAEHVEEYLAAADRAFTAGDYDGATEACKQVLLLDASNERAFATLDRIHRAADERHAALQSAVERGRAAFQSGNLMAALREVKQALALDPYDADALALNAETEQAITDRQEEAKRRAAIDAARRRFAAGDHRAALQSLEALPASSALVRAALDELRASYAEIEAQQRLEAEQDQQRRRIATLAAEARAAIAAGRLDDAMRIAADIRAIDSAAADLADINARVRDAQAAAQAREEIGRILAEFDARFAEGNLAGAEERLTAAAALSATDPRLPAARQRLADEKAARAAAEARQRQGEEAINNAAARLQAGDLAAADEMLRRAADLVPGHARAAELAEQLRVARERQAAAEAAERLKREVDDLIASASRHLLAAAHDAAELPIALARVNSALALDPGNAEATRLKAAIEADFAAKRDAARARTTIENAGRRFANGKHLAAIKLLQDFNPPNHPDVVKALGELRAALQVIEEKRRLEQERAERQQRLAALVTDARAALTEQRFDDALQIVAKAEDIDAAAADLAPLKEQIAREQAAARLRAEIEAIVADIDERLTRGELDSARELLAKATARGAADPVVTGARQRVDQAVAQREAAAARERAEAAAREREAAAAREREAAAAREREAALAREREAALAREREAALAREREAALAREREAALAREREAALARERDAKIAREREAAAAREREAAAAREREAAAAREREAAAARERDVAAAREREAVAAREREAAAAREAATTRNVPPHTTPPPGRIEADPDAETLFAGDLQQAVRAALSAAGRDQPRPATTPVVNAGATSPGTARIEPDPARRKADDLLAAARAHLDTPNPREANVTSALEKIEQALAAIPNDPAALALETTANETLLRLRDAARIDTAIRNARSRFAIGKHQAAIQLLEGLDPASHPAVADALKELRASLQAIEDRRRQEAAARQARPAPDSDATFVLSAPEVAALRRQQPDQGVTLFAPGSAPAAPAPAAEPGAAPPAPDNSDNQRRLMLLAGVLVAALLVAMLLLRFAS
jgi:serine/threonine protein kinase